MPAIQTSKFADERERKNSDFGPLATFQLDLAQVAGKQSYHTQSSKASNQLKDLKQSKKKKLSGKKQPEIEEMKFDDIDDDSDLE